MFRLFTSHRQAEELKNFLSSQVHRPDDDS
jgi:hypothetical protein